MASNLTADDSPTCRPKGYPSLARFISTSADGAVFRRFTELNVRNLLYLQSELYSLEEKLFEHDANDCNAITSDPNSGDSINLQHAAMSYLELKQFNVTRFQLVQNIKDVLKEYNEALVLFDQVMTIETPSRRVMKCLRAMNCPLIDSAKKYLEDEEDLAALAGSLTKCDNLTEGIRSLFGYTLRSKAVDEEQAIGYVSVKLVDRIVDIMKVFLATLFLGGAIIGLYFVKSDKIRLGIIPPLVGLFALCLTFSTTATKGEIYGVSAAYAAVLVVFVSGAVSA